MESFPRRLNLVFRQPELPFEHPSLLLQPLRCFPARSDLRSPPFGPLMILSRARNGLLRARQPASGLLFLRREFGRIGETRLECPHPSPDRNPMLPNSFLSELQSIVAEHPGEELGPLDRTHGRHDGELFLAGEVGIEEFFPSHAEHPADPRRDLDQAVSDRGGISILIQLRSAEPA